MKRARDQWRPNHVQSLKKKTRVPNQELQLNVLECLSPKKTWYTTFLMKFL